jgi:hypothetical protein
MELTDSATGQKVKFTFNGIDSGYWKELNQGLNPINCPKSDFDAYQFYSYNCVSSNDSFLKIKAILFRNLDGRYGGFTKGHRDILALEVNNLTSLFNLSLIEGIYPNFFFQKIEINKIKYDSVLISYQPSYAILPQAYFNRDKGILAIRFNNQLWQQK